MKRRVSLDPIHRGADFLESERGSGLPSSVSSLPPVESGSSRPSRLGSRIAFALGSLTNTSEWLPPDLNADQAGGRHHPSA